MEATEKIISRFRSAEAALLSSTSFSVGYGMDPDRKGPVGIVVYAMSDNLSERSRLLEEARAALSPTWEGYPVYFKGIPAIPAPRIS